MHRTTLLLLPMLSTAVALFNTSELEAADPKNKTIHVVVWDEQQPKQKRAYENFLGNAIADHLKKQPGLQVRSMNLEDPEQGLSADILDNCQVLIWWGHVRQRDITWETGKKIVERVKSGQLDLIILHSGHWSTPFIEAMNEVTRSRTKKQFAGSDEKVEFDFARPKFYKAPEREDALTPVATARKYPEGRTKVTVKLPNCCFPAYRPDGKPSFIVTLKPKHPIAKDLPAKFEVSQTEMYDEPFHVPAPDEVVFEERWPAGEWFRSGAVWNIGKGKLFYFRPGHETYPIYKQEMPLKVVTNAVRWLASDTQ